MPEKELAAPCGLNCGASAILYATRHNDARLRDRYAARLVLNPDRLSIMESRSILHDLAKMGIVVDQVILNRCEDPDEFDLSARGLGLPVESLPLSCEPLIGLPALYRYLDEHRVVFESMVNDKK